jgi:arylsulfatase A-like enzyme
MKNIIWILCDSVRNYKTDVDDRGKLDVMDSFSKDAVYFKNVVTAAPSTIMSVSSMMTSIPAPFQATDYKSFSYNKDLPSFPKILRDNGYETYSLLFWNDGNAFLTDLFKDNCPYLRPKNNSIQKIFSNDEQIDAFYKFLDNAKFNSPFFFWLHLNCRGDCNLSEKVERIIERLKHDNLYEDSIIVIGSDHGYPDPSRNVTSLEMREFGHDLLMYDDNIVTPQLIKFPGMDNIIVDEAISTLDLCPTILDYLGLYSDSHEEFLNKITNGGRSVLNNIQKQIKIEPTILRTDNRFLFQKQAAHSIRGHGFKYVESFYNPQGEFYDLIKDPGEKNNLIQRKEYELKVDSYRKTLQKGNKQMISHHANILLKAGKKIINSQTKYVLIGEFNNNFIQVFSKIFLEINNHELVLTSNSKCKIKTLTTNCNKKTVSVLSFPVSKDHKINTEIVSISQKQHSNSIIYLNYALNSIDRPKHWGFNILGKPVQYYYVFKDNPKVAFINLWIDIKKVVSYLISKGA